MPTVSEEISHILLKKLREEQLTPAETALLAEWEARSAEHKAFVAMVMDGNMLTDKIKGLLRSDEDAAWQRIEQKMESQWGEQEPASHKKIPVYKYAAAASIILVVGFAAYYFITGKPSANKETEQVAETPITPGGNKAVLTLADNSVIQLTDAKNGVLAQWNGSTATKAGDGKLVIANGTKISGTPASNLLTTPRGGQFQVQLPDGTEAWLNSESSIRFPTYFSENERTVEITGEVYFEVAKDPRRTFLATVKGGNGERRAQVEVLGTHFNIMAYDDEQTIDATLTEGKISIVAEKGTGFKPKILNPGQQAQITHNNKLSVVNVDTASIVGWKNGVNSFVNTDIKIILRQLSRWYNVEVVYEGNLPDKPYTVDIARTEVIANVLKMLEFNGIKLKQEGRKIIVLP